MTSEHDPLTEALRDNLHRRAADAPTGDHLAERIIAATEQRGAAGASRRRRGWRTWALPLVAAGAVAGVVAAVIAIEDFRPEASQTQPGGSSVPTGPDTGALSQGPSMAPTTPPPTRSTATTGLDNARVADLTFVGDDDGWALASAGCVNAPGRCTTLLRTTDGTSWRRMGGELPFRVAGIGDCVGRCVEHLRFADDQVGYAFGPSAFFMTPDGGRTWDRYPGGAIALETLDGNVIRVTGRASGCPGPCVEGIQTADIGATGWQPAAFAPPNSTVGSVQLVRGGGGHAYLLVTANPVGGAEVATSTLYRSADGGRTWTASGEPCTVPDVEVDSRTIAAAGDGRVTALCAARGPIWPCNVAWSDDGGVQFGVKPGQIPADVQPTLLAGDPATVLIAAGVGMARSTDGGHTWQRVVDVSGEIGWLGFESETVGRAVSADGSTIWTTRDGGHTWRPATLG